MGILGSLLKHIDDLVQERRNSIANAMELRLSCTNPLICWPELLINYNIMCKFSIMQGDIISFP